MRPSAMALLIRRRKHYYFCRMSLPLRVRISR